MQQGPASTRMRVRKMKLSRGSIEAVIDPAAGGRLASLRLDGEEVLVVNGEGATEWGCYPMVPWAGRVRNGQFMGAGGRVQLPINCPPHALHGTVFDAPWEFTGPRSLRSDLGRHWPWAGEVRSSFGVTEDSFEWRMEVRADCEAFPVVLGWHPWFRRSLSGGGRVTLDFEATEMYRRDRDGIPAGDRIRPTPGPWDDCFAGLTAPPRLTWSCGRALQLESSCSHWVVYDQPSHAVCVEPQSGPPDAFNLGEAQWVEPGAPVVHSFRIKDVTSFR